MVLPMAEMVGWLRERVGELIRRAGLQIVELLMEEEVRHLELIAGISVLRRFTSNRFANRHSFFADYPGCGLARNHLWL